MPKGLKGTLNPAWKGGEHDYTCEVCGKAFKRRPCYVARSRRNGFKLLTCSKGCSNRVYKRLALGNKNPSWKDGRTKTKKTCPACRLEFVGRSHNIYCSTTCYGTAMTWGRQAPESAKRNFKEYRKIAEEKIGRELESHEVVHHIDGNPQNNDPANLKVMTADAHTRMHILQRTAIRRDIEAEVQ